MSKRAYGNESLRTNGRSRWYGSSPTTLGTPGGRSQCSTGQRRAVATTVRDGSGFTAWGEPTLESNGTSKMLSLHAWQSARSIPLLSAHSRTARSLPVPHTKPSYKRPV